MERGINEYTVDIIKTTVTTATVMLRANSKAEAVLEAKRMDTKGSLDAVYDIVSVDDKVMVSEGWPE